jgi:hypothetical protein
MDGMPSVLFLHCCTISFVPQMRQMCGMTNSFYLCFTDEISQVVQTLFEDIHNIDQGHVCATLLIILKGRKPPEEIVRIVDCMWGGFNVDLSEDFLHQLEDWITNRRVELINALTPLVDQMQRQDLLSTAPEATLSQTSSLH